MRERQEMTARISMWSGPRNISTAMMRAFENRPDTAVVDEPFYAVYLAATGAEHPMRAEVLASQPTDWPAVAAALTGPVPMGRRVFYQKHMTHHMLPGVGREWTAQMRNAFLIRAPEDVWRHVQLGDELWVQRAQSGRWFVSIECECDWEPEHGLQLVLEDGARVTKVGPYDGHLTNAAAYADPTLEGVVYVGLR